MGSEKAPPCSLCGRPVSHSQGRWGATGAELPMHYECGLASKISAREIMLWMEAYRRDGPAAKSEPAPGR